MEPAPTEGWLGEGKSSKTWRGPFTVRRSAGTERDLQEIRGWEHSQCFPRSWGLWCVCWDPGPKPQSSGTLSVHNILSLSPLLTAFSGQKGFGPKLAQGTLPVRKIEGLNLHLPPSLFWLSFFLSFFFFFLPSWFYFALLLFHIYFYFLYFYFITSLLFCFFDCCFFFFPPWYAICMAPWFTGWGSGLASMVGALSPNHQSNREPQTTENINSCEFSPRSSSQHQDLAPTNCLQAPVLDASGQKTSKTGI